MAVQVIGPNFQLPWSASEWEDRRFYQLLRFAFVVFIAVAVVIPLIPVPTQEPTEYVQQPRRLARIVMEKKILPVTKTAEKIEKKPAVETKPKKPIEKAVEKPKKPNISPKTEKKEKLETKIVDEVTAAREVAKVSGVLAFQDDLMDMRDSLQVTGLSAASRGAQNNAIAKVERSIIVGMAGKSGRGISVSALSRDTGGSVLPGRETTKIENTAAVAVSPLSAEKTGVRSGRSDESIRREMDKNRGRIFTLYNRALRKNPALQGRFVFEMVIAPSGTVVDITLISSQLGDEILNRKILSRVKLISFGDRDVSETVVNYSFDFFPA